MNRWIAILLFALLPLQSVWAVAGDYCEHEQGADASHFGHHDHSHRDDDRDEPKSPSSKHPDCATCKLHAKTLVVVAFDLDLYASVGQAVADLQLPVTLSPPSRIERPKWASLVA
ncbi:MAG: hypothetical protein H2060_05265 [Azoarcus sp.]|nr:hypothetical protein [Azoarcus sp.]|tara:strand:- start:2533 stop:2877 length:345 start_codon:yes stop_codon:yes gene_type:complete